MRTVSKDRILAGVTLLPSILLVGIFVYGFIGNTFWTSLTDWGGVGALSENPEKNYIGFYNYKDLFVGFLSSGFRQDLVNAIFYSVFLLIGAIGVGLFIAILLDNKPKAEGFFRTVFLYPMSLSFIVTGTIWRWLLAPSGGVNVLPTYVGAEPLKFRWLSSTQSILQFDWQNILSFAFNIISVVFIVIGLWLLGKAKQTCHKMAPCRHCYRDPGLSIWGHVAKSTDYGRKTRLQPGNNRDHPGNNLAVFRIYNGALSGWLYGHFSGSTGCRHVGWCQYLQLLSAYCNSLDPADYDLGDHYSKSYFIEDVRSDLRHDRAR